MRTTSGDTGVAVPDESPMKTVENRPVNDVMHDPVTKIRSPDFPDFRARDDEGCATPDLIISICKIAIQGHEVAFEISLKP